MKSRNLLGVLAALGLVALAAGCKPDWPKCETTEDCNTEGHTGVCVDGTCTECAADSDCKPGFRCDQPTLGGNRCVPLAECGVMGDCPSGQTCKEGKCVACSADADCGSGFRCDAGACVASATCASDADCRGGQVCIDSQCSEPPQAVRCDQGPIRFGFNEYSLEEDAKRGLQTLADCLKKTQAKAEVTIEGHADERGTEEYNMALGEKRANAVKRYLVGLGVQGNRLRTVSYGEERPKERSSDEGAWAANRRAEFIVTGQ